MATMQSLERASDRHVAQRSSILAKLLRLLLGLWRDFDRWDDEDAVAGMAARSAMIVNSAIAQVRRAERSYLASRFQSAGLDSSRMPEVIDSYPRANTYPSQTYMRPVEAFIWARRNGGTLAESKEEFEQRLRAIAEADVRAAEIEEAQRVYQSEPRIIGYRRVLHPEKAESGLSCGLCVVAATRIYSTDELMPLHIGCNCDTDQITLDSDPGKALNDNDLAEIYNAAGGTDAAALLNTRVAVREHGELGPVLVKQGDHFRTPEQAGRPRFEPSTPERRARQVAQELAALTDQVESAQRRYDRLVVDDPSTLEPNTSRSDERVALFRSIRYMRELITSLEVAQRRAA
jgi:hypothetical protein